MEQNFFIKKGYQINKLERIPSLEESEDVVYWTPNRVRSSNFFQYYVYTFALNFMQKNHITSLVDVGCGPGKKLLMMHREMPKINITGIDQAEAVTYCKEKYDFGDWHIEDFEKPASWHKLKADLVICADVIEHLVNPDYVLDNIKKKLNTGGYVIISTPDRDKIIGKSAKKPSNVDHIREWNQPEFAAYLESRGFEILEHLTQLPIKASFNDFFLKLLIKRLFTFKPLRFNQVCLVKLKR